MSVRRQRDFTSDTAHELKTSVAVLKSSIQSSLQRPRTQREYQIGLEQLLEDCLRMEALLEKMLRLAQIEQASEDGAPRNAALTDVKSTCETALDRVRKMAEERGVTVELEASESIVLRADPDNLELVWMNLLENAVRHSVHGQTVKMRVVKSPPLMAQISVLDSGPGFAAVELPYIFQRFRRGVPNAGLSTDGFGLGLAICKAVVDSYGGTIEAINLPECGAELRVELPISQIL
jgi:signal transduction histidine kinase